MGGTDRARDSGSALTPCNREQGFEDSNEGIFLSLRQAFMADGSLSLEKGFTPSKS